MTASPSSSNNLNYQYGSAKENVFGLRIFRDNSPTIKLLVGVRKPGEFTGRFDSMRLLVFDGVSTPKVNFLPESMSDVDGGFLADFDLSGVLWYGRQLTDGNLRLLRITEGGVKKYDIKIPEYANNQKYKILKLRAISKNEVWVFGSGESGIWIKIKGNDPILVTFKLSQHAVVRDVIPLNDNNNLIISADPDRLKNKYFGEITHLDTDDGGSISGVKYVGVNGKFHGLLEKTSEGFKLLMSETMPGSLFFYEINLGGRKKD